MKYVVTLNDKNYEVEVERGEARIVKTTQAAVAPAAAPVQDALPAASVAQPAAPAVAVAGEKITAPMPGMVLQIKKSGGEPAKKGETIMILEAMKMENEIIAPRDGVIAQITAAKGASVNTGDVLAVMQ